MSRKPIPQVDPKGKEWPSFSAMCRAWGIDRTTVCSALARGKTLEQALTHTGYGRSGGPEVPPERRTDHHGRIYPTIKAMCTEYGINEPVYLTRRRIKWTVQRALETPVKRRSEPVTDHLGNIYPSVQAMCKAWGVIPGTYRRRREQGMDVETALEAPNLSCIPTRVDGKDYPSIAAAARDHAVDPTVAGARLQKGVPVDEAFRPPERHTVRGPDGRVYTNLDGLCEAYGISYSTYRRNVGEGMSLLDALTTKRGPAHRPLPSVDHTGRKFPTFAAMCEEWGRMPMTVRYRLRIGWTLEKALTRKGRLE